MPLLRSSSSTPRALANFASCQNGANAFRTSWLGPHQLIALRMGVVYSVRPWQSNHCQSGHGQRSDRSGSPDSVTLRIAWRSLPSCAKGPQILHWALRNWIHISKTSWVFSKRARRTQLSSLWQLANLSNWDYGSFWRPLGMTQIEIFSTCWRLGSPWGWTQPWRLRLRGLCATPPYLMVNHFWKSAILHDEVVDGLIEAEVRDGFIEHVPGGRSSLKQQYTHVAVGKLGVVIADGRSPRLVVDSSVSNVTANTNIPNHMMLPRISDVWRCAPSQSAVERMIQLTLDVSKAHRRILIHPDDRGLLCFHVRDELYKCITLNFGARASGWYWGRLAGFMVRASHALLDHSHALWQYVDDLLTWLDRLSAPLWSSALVILFLILGIPLSWHKAALSVQVSWIGWSICVETWTVELPKAKLLAILSQLDSLSKQDRLQLKELQSVVGRLLWLTGAWHHLRPLLIPFYKALHHIPVTMVGVSSTVFDHLLDVIDDDLILRSSQIAQHHSLVEGTQIKRVANTFVNSRTELRQVFTKSRRVWLGIVDPTSPYRSMDDDVRGAIAAWRNVLSSTSCCMTMRPAEVMPVQATADAMANEHMAGLGGAVFFADGSCAWFQFKLHLDTVHACCPWVGANMQKHIAAWELLAQFALTFCIESRLPPGHFPVTCHQGTDNSASNATAAKGLTTTPGMAHILGQYFLFMLRVHVFPQLSHIPGHLNGLADTISRFGDLPNFLSPSDQIEVDVPSLLCQNGIKVTNQQTRWPSTFPVNSN